LQNVLKVISHNSKLRFYITILPMEIIYMKYFHIFIYVLHDYVTFLLFVSMLTCFSLFSQYY